jgi:hypothetical protein
VETAETVLVTNVGDIVEAVRTGVERRLGKKRRLYSAEDLIEDVGLTHEQFEELLGELEHRFEVQFDPETTDQLTVAGALVVRLMRLCSYEVEAAEVA